MMVKVFNAKHKTLELLGVGEGSEDCVHTFAAM